MAQQKSEAGRQKENKVQRSQTRQQVDNKLTGQSVPEPSGLSQSVDSPEQLSGGDVQDLQRTYGNYFLQRLAGVSLDEDDEKADTTSMRQADDNAGAADVESGIQRKRGGGAALPEDFRQDMEGQFGTNFSGVRVHTDGDADTLSRSLNARSFTTGSDIFFKEGEYDPHSKDGQKLIAHELTHVVQQGGTESRPAQAKLSVNEPGDKYEQEADAAAEAAVSETNGPETAVAPGDQPAAAETGPPAAGDMGSAKSGAVGQAGGTAVPTVGSLDNMAEGMDAADIKEIGNQAAKQAKGDGNVTAPAVATADAVAAAAAQQTEADTVSEERNQQADEAAAETPADAGTAGAPQQAAAASAGSESGSPDKKEGGGAQGGEQEPGKEEGKKEEENKKEQEKGKPQAPKVKKQDSSAVEELKYSPEEIEDPEPAERLPSWNELAYGTIQLSVASEIEARDQLTGGSSAVDAEGGDAEAKDASESDTESSAAEPAANDINRSQLIADAFGAGFFQGVSEGATEFITDQLVESAFQHGPGKKVPYADGVMGIAQIAMDPAGWAEGVKSAFGKEGWDNMVSGWQGIGKEATWAGKIAATLEAILGVIDWLNGMLGVIQQVLQIILFVLTAIASALTASGVASAAAAVLLQIISVIEKINNIISAITNFLLALKPTLQLLAMLFRIIDIHIFEGDPQELMAKQAKLTGHVSGFTKSATQRGLNKLNDKFEASYAKRKQMKKAEEIANNDDNYTNPKSGKSRDDLRNEYRERYGTDPEVDVKVKQQGEDVLTLQDKVQQAEAKQYQAQKQEQNMQDIAQHQSKISESWERSARSDRQQTDYELQKARAEFDLADPGGSVNTAQQRVTDKQMQIAGKSDDIASKQLQITTKSGQVDQKQLEIDGVGTSIRNKDRDIETSQNSINAKTKEINDAELQLKQSQNEYDYYVNAMQGADEGRLNSLREGRQQAEENMRRQEQEVERLKQQKRNLETQKQRQEREKTQLEQERTSKRREKSNLEQQKQGLEQQKQGLERQKQGLEDEKRQLETARDDERQLQEGRRDTAQQQLDPEQEKSKYDQFWEKHKKLDAALTTVFGSPVGTARALGKEVTSFDRPGSLAEMKAGWRGQRHGGGPTGQTTNLISSFASAITGEGFNPFEELGKALGGLFVPGDKEAWAKKYFLSHVVVRTTLPSLGAQDAGNGKKTIWKYDGESSEEDVSDLPTTVKLVPSASLTNARFGDEKDDSGKATVKGTGFGSYSIPAYSGNYTVEEGDQTIKMTKETADREEKENAYHNIGRESSEKEVTFNLVGVHQDSITVGGDRATLVDVEYETADAANDAATMQVNVKQRRYSMAKGEYVVEDFTGADITVGNADEENAVYNETTFSDTTRLALPSSGSYWIKANAVEQNYTDGSEVKTGTWKPYQNYTEDGTPWMPAETATFGLDVPESGEGSFDLIYNGPTKNDVVAQTKADETAVQRAPDESNRRPLIQRQPEEEEQIQASPASRTAEPIIVQRQVDEEALPPQAAPAPAPAPEPADDFFDAEQEEESAALMEMAAGMGTLAGLEEEGGAFTEEEEEGGGVLGGAQSRLNAIRQARIAEMIDELPEPPAEAIYRVNAAASGYELVAAQEEVAFVRQQELQGMQRESQAQAMELEAARQVGEANQSALDEHQADIDQKLDSQDEMMKTSQEAGNVAQKGEASSNPVQQLMQAILQPVMKIFTDVASKFTDEDTGDAQKSTQEAGKSSDAPSQGTDMGKSGGGIGMAQASERKAQTQKAQAEAKVSEKEMSTFTQAMESRRDAALEGQEEMVDISDQNAENLEAFQSDKESFVEEHEAGQDEAEAWADEHESMREMMFEELNAELESEAERLASGEESEVA